MHRQAQHDRTLKNCFALSSVRPEPVEGLQKTLSAANELRGYANRGDTLGVTDG
jgi:hypothetical protein